MTRFFALCAVALGFFNSLVADVLLYSSKRCPYCRDVNEYLESVNKKVPTVYIDDDAKAKADLKAKGGKVQVPCLIVDDYPLYGSQEIIRWMKTHPERLQDGSK